MFVTILMYTTGSLRDTIIVFEELPCQLGGFDGGKRSFDNI